MPRKKAPRAPPGKDKPTTSWEGGRAAQGVVAVIFAVLVLTLVSGFRSQATETKPPKARHTSRPGHDRHGHHSKHPTSPPPSVSAAVAGDVLVDYAIGTQCRRVESQIASQWGLDGDGNEFDSCSTQCLQISDCFYLSRSVAGQCRFFSTCNCKRAPPSRWQLDRSCTDQLSPTMQCI